MIVVTGASGLVGSHLLQKLSLEKTPICAWYNHTPPTHTPSHITWKKVDITHALEVLEALEGATQVYHCAAVVSFSRADKEALYNVNVIGTQHVVNGCLHHQVGKLLFVSSVAALGRIRVGEAIHEGMQWSEETSNSFYGKTKYLAELEVWRGVAEGLSAVVINPVIILGCANWDTGSAAIFKNVYNEFPWYTTGSSGFVYVNDVVQAMLQLMNSHINNEKFIVSGGNHTYQQVFNAIAKGFGKKPPHKKVTPFLAAIVWRWEAVKSFFTGAKPLLTKETAHTAQAVVTFNNEKLLQALPQFTYTPLPQVAKEVCEQFRIKYQLP